MLDELSRETLRRKINTTLPIHDACATSLLIKRVLLIAGVYNLVWGLLVIGFPNAWFELSGMDVPNYSQSWKCVGMKFGGNGLRWGLAPVVGAVELPANDRVDRSWNSGWRRQHADVALMESRSTSHPKQS